MIAISDIFTSALTGLKVHPSRSILTIAGIVIGIISIVAVTSLGQGAQGLILGEIQKFGPTNVFLLPGRQPNGPSSAESTLLNDSLVQKDIDALNNKSNVPDAQRVIPVVFGQAIASYEGETYSTMIMGSTQDLQKFFDLTLEEGRFFDNTDVLSHANTAVIGKTVAKKLFGATDPLDKKIKMQGRVLRVVGVMEEQGSGSFVNFDKAIMAPYPFVQQDVLGIKYFQRVVVAATTVEKVPGMINDITRTLRYNHNIDNPSKDDFSIQTQESITKTVSTVTDILTVLLVCVAAISLVVGGVGIMNIMLVSVTERTREIGLRKALGATSGNVLLQFLIEALFLTISGGIVGVCGGIALSWGAAWLLQTQWGINFPLVVSPTGIVLGIVVSGGVGIAFGIFPAWAASHKSPIEALRHE